MAFDPMRIDPVVLRPGKGQALVDVNDDRGLRRHEEPVVFHVGRQGAEDRRDPAAQTARLQPVRVLRHFQPDQLARNGTRARRSRQNRARHRPPAAALTHRHPHPGSPQARAGERLTPGAVASGRLQPTHDEVRRPALRGGAGAAFPDLSAEYPPIPYDATGLESGERVLLSFGHGVSKFGFPRGLDTCLRRAQGGFFLRGEGFMVGGDLRPVCTG